MRVWGKRLEALRGAPAGVEGRLRDLEVHIGEFYVAEAEQWVAEAQAAEKPPR
jgi:hypothetical protein